MKTIYRKISVLLALIMTVVFLPQPVQASSPVWDGSVAEGFASGTGTIKDPYLIETPAQLAYLASEINGVSGNDMLRHSVYRLNADLDLGSVSWIPIGTGSAPRNFCGTFIGAGHTISNLKVSNQTYAGLFGNVAGANICDLIIQNADVTSVNSAAGTAGALLGSTGNSSRICNVHALNSTVKGKISGGIVGMDAAGSGYTTTICRSSLRDSAVSAFSSGVAGGILGGRSSSGGAAEIEGCYTKGGSVSALSGHAGGISGGTGSTANSTSGPIRMADCYNSAAVSSTSSAPSYSVGTGGILGYNKNTYSTVERCVNLGEIKTNAGATNNKRFAGGIIGYNIGATVSECVNAGTISLNGSTGNTTVTELAALDGYGHKAQYSYFLASSLPEKQTNVTINRNGTPVASEADLITQLNAIVRNHENWTIQESGYPTLKKCCENESHSCSCGCYCSYHEEVTPPHEHVDQDGDGKCDECGACLHEHDKNGYCIHEGCTHDEECCPKKQGGDEEDQKQNAPGMNKRADKTTASAGEIITYTLRSNVPDYLYRYIDLSTGTITPYEICIHDAMDASLIYQGDLTIIVGETPLASDLYTVEQGCADGCSFHVLMDLTEIYAAGNYFTYADLIHSPAITLTYSARVKDKETYGILTNTAHVEYEGTSSASATATTDVYAIEIEKVEELTGDALRGAQFTLYADEACTQPVASLESDENGLALAGGLKEGTYYLKETKAPEGFIRQTAEIRIELKDLQASGNLFRYKFRNAKIPSAGGTGIMIYTIGGTLLIGAAFLLLFCSRRRKDKEEDEEVRQA